jgi:hypothetical protein
VAAKCIGTAKNIANSALLEQRLSAESEQRKIKYNDGQVLDLSKEMAKHPRDGAFFWVHPVEVSFHLGRASRRTFKHAHANLPHAIAWAVIYGSALRMHVMTTLWATAIFGIIATTHLGITLATAHTREKEKTQMEVTLLEGAKWVHDNSKNLRSKAGENIVQLATLALIMGVTSQLKASVPAMSYGSLLTFTAAGITGFASAHYTSQQF